MKEGWLKELVFGKRCKKCNSAVLQGFSFYECTNVDCKEYGKVKQR